MRYGGCYRVARGWRGKVKLAGVFLTWKVVRGWRGRRLMGLSRFDVDDRLLMGWPTLWKVNGAAMVR